MNRRIRTIFSLVLAIGFILAGTGSVFAMSAEDQRDYNEWYYSRFGSYPKNVSPPVEDPVTPSPDPEVDPSPPSKPLQPAVPTAFEQEVINLLNQERIRQGLSPLIIDPYLVQAARIKGEDMVKGGYYSHNSPTYGYSSSLLGALGVPFSRSRENITVAGYASMAHDNFMSSDKHRDNMLKPYWTHVGVGVMKRESASSYYGYYVVEIFVQR